MDIVWAHRTAIEGGFSEVWTLEIGLLEYVINGMTAPYELLRPVWFYGKPH